MQIVEGIATGIKYNNIVRRQVRRTKIGENYYEFFYRSDARQAYVLYSIAFQAAGKKDSFNVQSVFEDMLNQAKIEYYVINI